MMKFLTIPTFALIAAVAACSGQSGTDATGASNTPVTAANKDQGKPGPHMGPGPAMLIFASLHEPINLTEAQRTTIQGLADSLKPKGPPPGAPDKAALAAAIRAGKIDVAALQPAQKPDFEAHRAEVSKALKTLHTTLTPEQRVALVAAIKKHHEDGPPHHDKDGKDGKGGGPMMMPKNGGPGHFGPMRMFEDLDLSADQKDAIKKELDINKPAPPTDAEREEFKKKHEAMRAEMDRRLDTFATANFDADAFLAPPADAPKGGPGFHGGDRFIKDLAVIVPILTPAQREKLAAKIEKGPPAPSSK